MARGRRRPAPVAPPPGPSRRALVASFAAHTVIFGTLLVLPAGVARRTERPERVHVVFYRPPVEIPPPVVLPVAPRKPVEPPPKEAEPPPRPVPAPRSEPPPVRAQRETRPEPPVAPPVVAARPEPPRPKVRTDVFRDKAPATASAEPRARQTRTGTFGAPASSATKPSYPARTSARAGGFEVPAASATADPPRDRGVTTAGFGDGVAVADARETRAPSHARVSNAAFDNGAPTGGGAPKSGKVGSVKQGQFGDGLVVAEAPRSRAQKVAKPETPVEIVAKPKPNYTEEARRLRVEGEVVLEVIFVSSGQLRVLGVLQSLGHGLDEAAIEAARSIEFKPARRNGLPVDHAATLHIVFQLA